MHKKKKRLRPSRRSRVNKQLQASSMDDWKLPDWIKQVQDIVDQGNFETAAEQFTQELIAEHINAASMPTKGFMMVACARLLKRMSQINRAEKLYKQLLELSPENIGILNEIAMLLCEQGKINEAVKYLAKAIKIDPNQPRLWTNLGSNLVRLGQSEKGVKLLQDAVEKMPNDNLIWSNLLFSMHYLPDVDRDAIFEKSRQWASINAPADMQAKTHSNTLDPERKLRIGYISPDFREHSVIYFFEPLLDGHYRDVVELYGYAKVAITDSTTERIKNKFDHYRNVYGLDDKATAELIEKDGIDILVDLAGHAGDTGIYAMAYKPAPIQVTWLGYPDTTGMTQIDYRLTDSIADPEGAEKFHSEKLVYLPDGFLCYSPGDVVPAMSALPFNKKGYITFGSFNNSAKINPFVIELWSRILKQTPNSRLLLKFKAGEDEQVGQIFIKEFEKFGISSDRISISGWLRSPEHLELYNQVDIALDTFPYNGTTTTCQAFLMGLPVISLVGRHHMSRVGLSILTRIGMEFFAASTPDEYVAKAVALAAKPDSLEKIRASMRTRLASSELCNNIGFARSLEQTYRKMWHQYCQSRGVEITADQVNEHHEIKNVDLNSSEPVQDKVPQMPKNKIKSKRGILYIIWGDKQEIENSLERATDSARQHHPELPIHVERLEKGNKITKTKMLEMTPFEETVFLDNDTAVMGRLDFGFEKAAQFGLACTLNGCPFARRYRDKRLTGDMIEYSSGVIFFTEKARPVFDAWNALFPKVDCSALHYKDNKLCVSPAADQASFALAIEQTGFLPFILPHNWNLHPEWNRFFFGPIKIWHGDYKVPESLLNWNENQSDENAVVRSVQMDVAQPSI